MESTSDNELLERLRQGDGSALKVLFERYFSMLAAVGGRICRDGDAGKDVAQKVFISLWVKRGQINVDGALAPYLKRMAINEALGRQRKDSRRQVIRDGLQVVKTVSPSGEQQLLAEETMASIESGISKLPDKTREVFVLSRYEEMSYKEISETLNISVKTVEYHMGRALLELRRFIRLDH